MKVSSLGSYDTSVIITGGCGFIGSHVVEFLVSNGYNVIVMDNKSSGNYSNIKDFYTGEVNDLDKLNWYPRIPYIIHLGIPSYYKMFEDNTHLFSKTISEFIKILDYCKRWKSRLVFASTASLYYGNDVPFRESMYIYPRDLYSECYYHIERLADIYTRLYGVNAVGLRIFNCYGTREAHKGSNASIIYQLINAIGSGTRPVIYDDGNQFRDFIYIDDVVDAILLAMKSKERGIFNIGTGTPYSFNELVDLISLLMNVEIEPIYVKSPINNYIRVSQADTRLAKSKLKFTAKVEIEKGVGKVMTEALYRGLFKDDSSDIW